MVKFPESLAGIAQQIYKWAEEQVRSERAGLTCPCATSEAVN